MAGLEQAKRLNEEQREHIKKLKQELTDEKNKVKEIKDDKLREIKAAREEEQTRSNAEKEELRQKLERQHQEDMIKKMEEEQNKFRNEVDRLKRSHATELQAQIKKLENDKKEGEEKVKRETTQKLKDELESAYDGKVKKLTTSLFKNEEKLNELEDRIADLSTDNATLKATIQANDKENEKTIESLKRRSKMESQQQIEEIKQKEKELQEKVKELAAMSRKCSEAQAAKEKLEYKLELQRQSAAINVPPTSLTSSKKKDTGAYNEITEESETPFISHSKVSHSELLLKNSELGYLVHTLQKEIDSLSKEKTDLERKVDVMEKEIVPLKERHQDNLMKIHKLRSDVNTKQKQLEKANEEKSELEAEKVATERKLAAEHDRVKTRDKQITELQKAKDEKERKLVALKSEFENYKETGDHTPPAKDSPVKTLELQKTKRLLREKDKELNALKEEIKHYKERKSDRLAVISPTPSPVPTTTTSPSVKKRISDNTLASVRATDHKKIKELEKKVEDLSTLLQEKTQNSYKQTQRIEDLNLSLKRRDKQLKNLSDDNYKLKSTKQMLEESLQRNKQETRNDWTERRSDLERAHAQINKLQQEKSALRETIAQLEGYSSLDTEGMRRTPSPLYNTEPLARSLSPQPRSLLQKKSPPRARSVSPQPRATTSKSVKGRSTSPQQRNVASSKSRTLPSPQPRATSSPQPRATSSPQPRSLLPKPNMTSSPLPQVLPQPTFSSKPVLHVSFEEDDFGSQWSLASTESILKEQLEQMEYDKDEVSIQYEELRTAYGRLKGNHNVLRERYKSLLARSKSIHSKLQQREKERLELERELTLLQEEAQNEFDVKRESNLRDKLEQSQQRIKELEEIMEEQFNKSGKDMEDIEVEREKNQDLIILNEELLQQLEKQKETIGRLEFMSDTRQIKLLQDELESSKGHLEGERAVVASLKHQIQTLREERAATSPLYSSTAAPLSTLQPKLHDCLVSMNDVAQEMKRVIKTDPAVSSPRSQEYLIEQMEEKLREANGLLKGHTPAVTTSFKEEGFEETDAPVMDETLVNKNEKFQEWLTQFQKEKASLKSKIEHLEERLTHGSDHVSQLKNLVVELESRLKNEQDLHVSLLAERDEHINSLSSRIEVSRGLKEKVMSALDDTNEAVERQNIGQIQIEMDKLDKVIRELLLLAYSRDSTPFPFGEYQQDMITPHMMSPVGIPMSSPPQSTEASFSLSPSLSPFKNMSPTYSYTPTTDTFVTIQREPTPVFTKGGQNNKPRLYVTLFDYNPKSLCSTGHPEKELDLHTGDVISVVGDMNSNGYFTAEFEGKRGLVPAAFIQEMNINDKEAQYRLLNQTLTHSNATSCMGSEVELIPPLRKVTSLPSSRPAPPTSFQVEKNMGTSSLLVTWTPPQLDANGQSNGCIVTGYCILCDGMTVLQLNNPLATQGVLKDVDVTQSHVLSIFTVSINRIPSLVSTYQYIGISMCYMRALYDYDPDIDSPNATPGIELDFEKEDIITVYGEMRKDGFYNGEINGRYGLVPSNFLTPHEESSSPQHVKKMTISTALQEQATIETKELKDKSTLESTAKRVRAVYTYNPILSSPNKNSPSLELGFEKGDVLTVYGEMRKDGFYIGENNGQRGLIPSNFIAEIDPQDTPISQPSTPTRQLPTADIST